MGLIVSFDMAWHKWGSGNQYDSFPGHSITIGGITKKVPGIIVYGMRYERYSSVRKKTPVQEHACPLNYAGLSKGMEATAALDKILSIYSIYKSKIYVRHIVSNDYNTIRAKLYHAANNEHGKLPLHIVQPIFWEDPGHRIKTMAKPAFALAKATLAFSIVQICDTVQYCMYVGCCVKQTVSFLLSTSKVK